MDVDNKSLAPRRIRAHAYPMTALLFLALLALLGAASALGLTHDSRDQAYSLGLVIRRSRPEFAERGYSLADEGPRSSVDRATAF